MVGTVGEKDAAPGRVGVRLAHGACRAFPIVPNKSEQSLNGFKPNWKISKRNGGSAAW